ncbi:hypothetical protein MPLDJ20_20133 [Mesorhizobium plurifarium]|uniref:Uncharacterized protein n=1 Tax=Mesorhizobium plurifarium TaxID=69974 RepID=A0A090GKE9_MESPL|nr:hypothetical protein MPLDJ20_20133 [Mesorhizobium plurifarium]
MPVEDPNRCRVAAGNSWMHQDFTKQFIQIDAAVIGLDAGNTPIAYSFGARLVSACPPILAEFVEQQMQIVDYQIAFGYMSVSQCRSASATRLDSSRFG